MENILLDTDMLTDCDDAAALAILLNLEAKGDCRILGMSVSSRHPLSAVVVQCVNTYYNRGDILIGAPKHGRGAYRSNSCFLETVCSEFSHRLTSNDDAPDAVTLYRRVLSEAAERSVTIVTIGYMTNVAALLDSQPDDISPLDGISLAQQKVKRWICMGGNFPVDDATDNVNFTRDMASAYSAITLWPGEIHFVGREIGHQIFAGEGLRNTPEDNPVRRAYQLHRGRYTENDWNHHTADPTTILYAVYGCRDFFTLSNPGSIDLCEDGRFAWREHIDGKQRYLLQKMQRNEMAELLDRLMSTVPSKEIS